MQNPGATANIKVDRVGLRWSVMRAAERWGIVNLQPNPELDREWRMRIRAYAEAYGVAFDDLNDDGPGGPLTRAELAQLPALRREARAGHLAEIVVFRLLYPVWRVFHVGGSTLAVVLGFPFRRWVILTVLIGAALYLLLGVACGFASPAAFGHAVFGRGVEAYHWAQANPHQVWRLARMLAGIGFAGLLLRVWLWLTEPPAPTNAPVPVRRLEIENFREQSAFGDASLAQKQQVARALRGQGGFAPKYEE